MAEVSFLYFPEELHTFFLEHDLFLQQPSTPSPHDDVIHDDVIFPSIPSIGSSTGSHFTHNNYDGIIEESYDVGDGNGLDSDLGLGLGFEEGDNIDDCNFVELPEFVASDCDSELKIEDEIGNDFVCGSSRVGGLMMVGIDSDSDIDDGGDDDDDGNELWRIHVDSDDVDDFGLDNVDDLGIPLQWDSFRLDDDDDDDDDDNVNNNVGVNHDLEWEELCVDYRVDSTEIRSVLADHDDENSIFLQMSGPELDEVEETVEMEMRNLEWEVLLNVTNLDSNHDSIEYDTEIGPLFGDHEDMMFGQFVESENAVLNRPPASKSVIEKLPSVITTKEDVADEKTLCAVCKDQIVVGEEGKELPCRHRYHGDCIVPWLGIRNTCPVCRFELETDDVEYERRRVRRGARAV